MTISNLRNIAIIAHVDHGKTTLVDQLLKQSGTFDERKIVPDRVMDSNVIERERGITILAKNTAIRWRDYRINIVDTPGHADFGGEVERVLSMVDCVLLLVDAVDGPMPQTRFVTQKAFSHGLRPIVVINKVDRDEARPSWVLDQTFDLFDRLGASEAQLDFPVVYASALRGFSGNDPKEMAQDMTPLFEAIVKHCPQPDVDAEGPLQLQVSQLDYSSYVGAIGIGRIKRGTIKRNSQVVVVDRNGKLVQDWPHLEKMFHLARRAADYLGFEDHPYDALLDTYEPGAKTAHIKTIFADLRQQTLPLLKAIQAKGDATDYSVLERSFPVDKQREFGLKIARALGLPEKYSRLDVSAHPFCTHFGPQDIRITTRFDEHYFPMSLFGTWHETGHGLYEHGVALELDRTPLAGGASLGIHESQSRLYENLVCRSKPFWERYYPQLEALVPEVTQGVSLEEFYKAINRVEADLIRVEADEVTYNFHIMLRFELETALLEGNLKVSDLPEAWNAKMQDYLGVTPPNDAQGVMQDVHWSAGLIGYFPTYSLGNLLSVQLFKAAEAKLGDLHAMFRAGNFAPLLEWLRENVHQHGRKLLPHEIATLATGKPLEATDYVNYLKEKYSAIYGL